MFPDAYAFEIVNIAGDGPVVLTERLDYIQAPNGEKPAVPVMGTFVVDDNKITRWTDYFDINLTVKLLQGEDITALVPDCKPVKPEHHEGTRWIERVSTVLTSTTKTPEQGPSWCSSTVSTSPARSGIVW